MESYLDDWQEQINDPHSCKEDDHVDPLLSAREAIKILRISIATFWRRVADGTVPQPLKIGGLSRWPKSEILGVIDSAKFNRDAK